MGLHILDFILVDSFIVEGYPLGQSLIDTIQYMNLNPFPAFTLNHCLQPNWMSLSCI